MRIGVVGGTGKEGRGMALRWARAGHDVFLGSRDAERARATAEELSAEVGRPLQGGDNASAVSASELVDVTLLFGGDDGRDTAEAVLFDDFTICEP